MIKPETSDFFGNELDKAKLEIASYWKDKYEDTQKKLDIAVEALKCICEQGMSLKQFEIPRHVIMLEEASEALDQINDNNKG